MRNFINKVLEGMLFGIAMVFIAIFVLMIFVVAVPFAVIDGLRVLAGRIC